ncbi:MULTISPECIES: two-component system response regulator [Anaeromyxobacter]|uniref:response regulator n=1 Tax=Anaeromyxobacter TaxID=161492 RepID=UPI001F57A943|nr:MULTISPECIES: response regulator [unclassified Anaeromyxobacter]
MQTPVRILVVDDAEPVRQILVQTLRALGFEPLQADSGPAALRLALAVQPAVAIVDQWMPEMTGAELILRLHASPDPRVRAMTVIGLSGRPGSERDLLAAGALTFLPKPFRVAQLVAALRVAMEPALPAPTSSAA